MKRLLLFILLSARVGYSSEGVISYGGDELIRNFFEVSYQIAEDLESIPKTLLGSQNASVGRDLKNRIKQMKVVVSSERLFWNDSEVMAINYPHESPPRIVVSKSRWMEETSALRGSVQRLKGLVLHELLPLTGRVDLDYQTSQFLSDLVDLAQQQRSSESLIFALKNGELDFKEFAKQSDYYFAEMEPDEKLLAFFQKNIFLFGRLELSDVALLFRNYFVSLPEFYCGYINFKSQIYAMERDTVPVKVAVYREGVRWMKTRCSNW